MQLSPSTPSLDPNLLALLFSVATPPATPVTPAGGENASIAGDAFEQLFASLAPAAPNPANVAFPAGVAGIARPHSGTRSHEVAQPGIPGTENGIEVTPGFEAGDAASEGIDDVFIKSPRAQGRLAASLRSGDPSDDIGADASAGIDSADSRALLVDAVQMQNATAPSAVPVEMRDSEAKNATTTQTVSEHLRNSSTRSRSRLPVGTPGKYPSEAMAPGGNVSVFPRNNPSGFSGSNSPAFPSRAPVEAHTDANNVERSSTSMTQPGRAVQDEVTTSFPPENASASIPRATRDTTPPAPGSPIPARLAEAVDDSATPASADPGVQMPTARPAAPADYTAGAFVATRDGVLPPDERIAATAGHEANFADDEAGDPQHEGREDSPADKSFVTTNLEELTTPSRRVGIDVANSAAVMSHPAPTAHPPHPVFEYRVDGIAAAGNLQELPPETTQHPSEVNTAQRAVEAVLHAADRVWSREQSSVNLQFSVGDADLEVRVELHGGEVRTTFRTDSAELRAALSQEWQAVAGAGLERTFRLAPAVFAAADRSAQDAFSGDTASRQHDRNPHRGDHDDHPAFANSARAGGFAPLAASAAAGASSHSSRSPLSPAGVAHRLNLFA